MGTWRWWKPRREQSQVSVPPEGYHLTLRFTLTDSGTLFLEVAGSPLKFYCKELGSGETEYELVCPHCCAPVYWDSIRMGADLRRAPGVRCYGGGGLYGGFGDRGHDLASLTPLGEKFFHAGPAPHHAGRTFSTFPVATLEWVSRAEWDPLEQELVLAEASTAVEQRVQHIRAVLVSAALYPHDLQGKPEKLARRRAAHLARVLAQAELIFTNDLR